MIFFAKFYIFSIIFARLCVFFNAFYVLIFQAKKLCLCYFSRFFQLCRLVSRLIRRRVSSLVLVPSMKLTLVLGVGGGGLVVEGMVAAGPVLDRYPACSGSLVVLVVLVV